MQVHGCLLEQIGYAVAAGIDVVQIREDDLDGGRLASVVRDAVALAKGSRTKILVNDRVDVALAAGAAGVHLKSRSMPAAIVRRVAPEGFLIGASIHSRAEAEELSGAVDYLIAGTVWPTASKPPAHPCLGLDAFARLAAAMTVPTLAIGGVSAARVADVAGAGGAGVAGIGLFMGPDAARDRACRAVPLERVVEDLRASFDRARRAS